MANRVINKNEVEIINKHKYFIEQHSNSSIKDINKRAIDKFKLLGFPHTKHEMYTFVNTRDISLRPFTIVHEEGEISPSFIKSHTYSGCEDSLIVMVDGFFNKSLSNIADKAITIDLLSDSPNVTNVTDYIDKEDDVFALLNISFTTRALVVSVTGDIDTPIQLLNISTGSSNGLLSTIPSIFIRLSEGIKAKLINKFVGVTGGYFINSLLNIDIASNAELYYSQVQYDNRDSWHFSKVNINLSKKSRFISTNTSSGSRLTRHSYYINLIGDSAELSLNSLSILEDDEQVHNYVRVSHNGLSCVSNQRFRNILNNKSLSSVDTTVVVNKGAILTQSDQLINNLMLSEESRADTKPNLMIFADDVKCTHGATVGQVDDDQLLYLKTRGLSDKEARSLVTTGFAKGIIESMFHRPVVDEVYKTLFKKLEGAYGG